MKEFNTEWSCFSKLKNDKAWKPNRLSPYAVDKRYGEERETWENEWPTRTNLSKFDEHKEDIIAIFGDSFLFGDGLPKKYCLSQFLNRKSDNNGNAFFLNLAKPGSSNEAIMRRMEQWTNEEKSDQTKTIVVGLSSMLRQSFYMNVLSPGLSKPSRELYNECLVGWDFHIGLQPKMGISPLNDSDGIAEYPELQDLHSNFGKYSKKATNAMTEAWVMSNLHLSGPANSFIKNVEVIIRRLNWLTLAKKWNIIFIDIQFWEQSNNQPGDWEIVHKYLKDMNRANRKIEIVPATFLLDTLDCGHWSDKSMKKVSNLIWDAYKRINNG